MTSLSPDVQATGALPIVVVVDETRPARHRPAELPVPNIVPAPVQLLATVIAFAMGLLGVRTAIAAADPTLILAGVAIVAAAVMILAATFTPDIDAAIRARITEREAGE
jgi:hypothetical protein